MLRPVAAALFFVLALSASPAGAQKKPEINRITQTDATSNCIGDPRTPLRAAETYLACTVRRDRSLCDAVNIPKDFFFSPPKPDAEYLEFIIEIRYQNRPKKFSGSPKGPARHNVGTVEFHLQIKNYFYDPAQQAKSKWYGYLIETQKTGERWNVISWAAEMPEFVE